MTSLLYIVQSTPWIAAGLIVGFFVGRSTVAASAFIDAVHQEGDDDMRESSVPTRKFRFTSNGVLAALLIALGIGTAVQAIVQDQADDRQDACLVAYSNGFADALEARSAATTDAQNAQDELWTTVAALSPTPESREVFRKALAEYLKKRAEAKKAQSDHPFPAPPRDVCKEAG